MNLAPLLVKDPFQVQGILTLATGFNPVKKKPARLNIIIISEMKVRISTSSYPGANKNVEVEMCVSSKLKFSPLFHNIKPPKS